MRSVGSATPGASASERALLIAVLTAMRNTLEGPGEPDEHLERVRVFLPELTEALGEFTGAAAARSRPDRRGLLGALAGGGTDRHSPIPPMPAPASLCSRGAHSPSRRA